MKNRRGAMLAVAFAALLSGCAEPTKFLKSHFATDQHKEGEKSWREVRARVKLQLAQQFFDGGSMDDARAAVREAIELNGAEPAAFVILAKVELREGHPAAARKAIASALELPGCAAEGHYVAGMVEERYENFAGALTRYEEALAADPNKAEYVLAEAHAMVKVDRPVEAIQFVEGRLADFPDEIDMRLFIAETSRMLGLKDATVAAYREAARLATDNQSVREELGLALEWAGQDEEAVAVLAPLVYAKLEKLSTERRKKRGGDSENPNGGGDSKSFVATRALARAYLDLNQPREARDVLKQAVTLSPEDVESWSMLTRVGVAMGDRELARMAAERVAALPGGDATAAALGAYLAFKEGDTQGALRGATSALEANPRDVMALCVLAWVQSQTGEKASAARTIDRALRIDPDCGPARLLKQQISGVTAEEAAPAASTKPENEQVRE